MSGSEIEGFLGVRSMMVVICSIILWHNDTKVRGYKGRVQIKYLDTRIRGPNDTRMRSRFKMGARGHFLPSHNFVII